MNKPTTFLALVYQRKIKRRDYLLIGNMNLCLVTKSLVSKRWFLRKLKNIQYKKKSISDGNQILSTETLVFICLYPLYEGAIS